MTGERPGDSPLPSVVVENGPTDMFISGKVVRTGEPRGTGLTRQILRSGKSIEEPIGVTTESDEGSHWALRTKVTRTTEGTGDSDPDVYTEPGSLTVSLKRETRSVYDRGDTPCVERGRRGVTVSRHF